MKKKGFTLVELLAVIVILAVILVIAVPKIMDTINNSKEGTLISSAKLIAAQAEKKYVENQVLEIYDTIECDEIVKTTDTDYDVCYITFDSDGKASVTIAGKGKFEGMAVCDGTKTDADISSGCYTDEDCFTTSNVTGGVEITGYSTSCGVNVWIPETIDSKTVKGIADYAFDNTLSETYKNDGNMMLLSNNMYNYKIVPIDYIPWYGIQTLKLPNTLEYIGEEAFKYNQLRSITIPKSVTSIGEMAFDRQVDEEGNSMPINVYLGNPDAEIGCQAFGLNIYIANVETSGLPDDYVDSCR